jgi:hypothetical protein
VHLLVQIINYKKMHGEYKVKHLLKFNFKHSHLYVLCLHRTSLLSMWHFIFWSSRFQISYQKPATLLKFLVNFPQIFQTNAVIISQIRRWSLSTKLFSIHCSLTIVALDVVYSDILSPNHIPFSHVQSGARSLKKEIIFR